MSDTDTEITDILKGYGIRDPKVIEQFNIKELILAEAKAAIKSLITKEVVKARIDELKQLQIYWTDLSMVVPRLQASPPQVKEHIVERISELKSIGGDDESS